MSAFVCAPCSGDINRNATMRREKKSKGGIKLRGEWNMCVMKVDYLVRRRGSKIGRREGCRT